MAVKQQVLRLGAVAAIVAAGVCRAQDPQPRPKAGREPQNAAASPQGAAARDRAPRPAFPWSGKQEVPVDRGRDGDFFPRPGDPVRIEGKDGRGEWTLWGATIENFGDYLRSLSAPARNEPDFSISSFLLTGAADDEQATLTATIKIEVARDGSMVEVPIELQEAFLRPGFSHQGPGQFRLAPTIKRGARHLVYLSGKGLHVLTLPMVVTIRRQLNQRRLQLTVPTAAGRELLLEVPKKNCEVKPLEGTAHFRKTTTAAGTQIDVVGLKGPFELAWEYPVEESQARTVFDVVSLWTLGMDQDRVQLGVRQTLEPKQGNLASVRVRIPTGFRSVSGQQLNVSDAKKYTAADVDPAGFIKVNLRPVGTGRIELRWDLEMDRPAAGTIALRGFDVEGARSETGDVSVTPAEGFHFDYRGGSNVRRVNPSMLGAGLAESAYNYSQPFRLEIALEEIRPLFTVEPTSFVLLSGERAEVTAQFHVQTRRGAVRELDFRWPEWKKQGWTLEQLPEDSEVVEIDPKDPAAGNTMRFRLKGRRAGDFVVALRAARPIPRGVDAFPLSLPTPAVSPRSAGTLVVADAENVKSNLQPRPETVERPIAAEAREKLNLPESFRGLRLAAWRIDSETCSFDAQVSPQKQRIKTESTTKLELREARLVVTQRITYHVDYERLSEAVLVLPAPLQRAEVRFYVGRNEPGNDVSPNWTPADSPGERQARLSFFDPRIGVFDIFARYSISLPQPALSETSFDVTVPLLRSRDAVFKSVRVELRARDDMEVEVVDDAWSPQLADAANTHAWMAAGDQTAIPLRLVQTATGSGSAVKISKALLRSLVDVSGAVRTAANYRIEGPASSVSFSLPGDSTDLKFSIDGLEIKPEGIRETRPGSREYRLDFGTPSPGPYHILTIDFVEPAGTPCGFASLHRLEPPLFADSTSIGSVMWEVTLPFEQFLFLDPSGFTPEFRWQHEAAYFVRKPTRRAADLAGWLGPKARPYGEEGNSYVFSRYGPVRAVVVGSMAQSSVFFVGAGLSLLFAFVLFKVSRARTLRTLFVFAFAIAVVSLWYAEAVRLMLQPALVGFLLALGAAIIDLRIQRRRERFLLAVPSAADFASAAASPSAIGRAYTSGSNPEIPAGTRPTEELVQQPVSSEMGSHL